MAESTHRQLSEDAIVVLKRLTQEWAWPLANGDVQVVRANVPGHMVVGIARQDRGPIWVIMNDDKCDVQEHLSELLKHWPAGVDDEVADKLPPEVVEALPFDDGDEGYEPDS